jgi:hypothetical protein
MTRRRLRLGRKTTRDKCAGAMEKFHLEQGQTGQANVESDSPCLIRPCHEAATALPRPARQLKERAFGRRLPTLENPLFRESGPRHQNAAGERRLPVRQNPLLKLRSSYSTLGPCQAIRKALRVNLGEKNGFSEPTATNGPPMTGAEGRAIQ